MSSNFSRDFIKAYFGSRFFSGELPKLVEKKKFVLNPNAKEFVPEKKLDFKDYVLKVRFLINLQDHDGYCSDAGETKTSQKYSIDVISIPKYLNDWDLFDSHLRVKDISILNENGLMEMGIVVVNQVKKLYLLNLLFVE
jgi:hypothetical protein